MAEQATVEEKSPAKSTAVRDVKADLDERRIARGVAVGLPLVTVSTACVVGVLIGPSMAILILAAGMLLGVISLFWASLRVLSGDAALSPELEALDATAHAVDALSSRKRMLVRALKDLDNERALGKLEADDHEELSNTYRAELKEVLKRIDASLEPHRPKAESAAHAFLLQAGLVDTGYRGAPPPANESAPVVEDTSDDDEEDDDDVVEEAKPKPKAKAKAAKAEPAAESARLTCPKCAVSNEPDATFCKKCGTALAAKADAAAKESVDEA
jgi:ribosomal protein L40E